ncbi:MAG: pyocin activator PrtN family protein [Bauldia sp.]|nr:pyocin activator PrtN family protein [Bauldia sp.]
MAINTAFLLMAQYSGKAIIPLNDVCRDYFSHVTPEKMLWKISPGEIAIPVVRMEPSQKSARGIHLQDLAEYLDRRRQEAKNEFEALYR